jgi:hypothetical protein
VTKQWSTKDKKEIPATKTGVPREVPVHPLLAKILAEWRLSGWRRTYGRIAKDDDLISPNPFIPGKGYRLGGPDICRRSDTLWEQLDKDCKTLGLEHHRVHDTRRTFITLARQDGAREDMLKWVTHGRPKGIMNVYSEPPWELLAGEVMKLKIELRGTRETATLKKAIGFLPAGTLSQSVTQRFAKPWIQGRKRLEPAGIETVAPMSLGVPSAPSMSQDPSVGGVSSDAEPASRTLDVSFEPVSCDIVTAVTGLLRAAIEALKRGDIEMAQEAARGAELELQLFLEPPPESGG